MQNSFNYERVFIYNNKKYHIMFERAKKDYKPPKPKKQRIHFSLSLELLQSFETYCEKNGYKRNELIECVLEEFLNKYGKKK